MFVPPLRAQPGPVPVMVRRVMIAQAAVEKFRGQPFKWGTADCASLAAFVIQEAGYDPALSRFGRYASERTALKALQSQGMSSMADALDSIEGLERIAPLAGLPGDLMAFPAGTEGWDALAVVLGNGRVLGFHPDAGGACAVVAANLRVALAAWRVQPCLS